MFLSLDPVLIFITHLIATVFMTGVIWFVQVVHYPMFEVFDRTNFIQVAQRHSRLTTMVVAPPMLLEAATALWLLCFSPFWFPVSDQLPGLLLLGVIWLGTAFLSIPCHRRFSTGYCQSTFQKLVATNWVRTVAWSLRAIWLGAIAFAMF